MKQIFTLLFFVAGSVSMLFSQVRMTKETHGFVSGMSHNCVMVDYQQPGQAGKGQTWDFSAVKVQEDVEQQSFSELKTDFDAGNIKAERNDGFSFYFLNNENVNEYWGFDNGSVSLRLTQPIVKTRYPQEFGTNFNGNFAGVVTYSNATTREFSGKYSTEVDGAGTLILPGSISLQTIRVKTTVEYGNLYEVKYLWYSQNERLPLFVTFEEYTVGADGTKTPVFTQSNMNVNIDRNPGNVTGIANLGGNSYKILENPFKSEISLTYSLAEPQSVTIELLSASGAKIATLVSDPQQSGSHTVSKNVSALAPAGVYLLKLKFGDRTYTEKVVKTY
ncbi:MAG: T9SS type A sorting domain-containing protein [Dysgonamonadaceae bacterium]|jgi:hypothetical protein|nr:T9SS type A sorting domain-containing protein [Dysgonamonadaceae bacterium]